MPTLLMPALSAGMEEGTIARWLKLEGDKVEAGDIIAEVETDKATMEYEAEQAGILIKLLASEGSTVAVNAPIAVLRVDGESDVSAEAVLSPAVSAPAPAPQQGPAHEPEVRDRVKTSPLARRIAGDRGVALDGLSGSGPRGRIVRMDVEAALTTAEAAVPVLAPVLADVPPNLHREVPHSNVRKVIARRLSEAKATIPHFYLEAECELDALLDLRAQINAQFAGSSRLSLNDFVVKAAALAVAEVPQVNAAWTEAAMLVFDDVDIAVAVATEGGLVTPIVRRADRKSLTALSREISDLADRAREGKLRPEQYQGGGFTVSNLGMYGVHAFSAIINPPQSCILAVGAAQRRPVVREETCVPATMMTCTLSVDHRAVDGATGAKLLGAFKALIEAPLRIMA